MFSTILGALLLIIGVVAAIVSLRHRAKVKKAHAEKEGTVFVVPEGSSPLITTTK